MGFLSPMQLAWAATVIAVVLLYMRWAPRKVYATTTLPIWEHAIARRRWWSRWRRPVSILAACVPIALIALALARPFLSPAMQQSRSIVVVVDNTASMNAKGRGRSRLEEAKRQARRLIRSLRTHDRMAILSADSTVRVRCGLTHDRTTLHLALDAVQPTDGLGAMNDAIATARRLIFGEPKPSVIVISDAGFDTGEAAGGEEVVWLPIRDAADNLAITRLAARPSPQDSAQQQVLVEVANYGSDVATVQVELQVDGQSPIKLDFNLPVGASSQAISSIAIDKPVLLTAKLIGDDVLAADNTAAILLTPLRRVPVVLVTASENSPLHAVLESLLQVEFTTARAVPSAAPEDTILIIDDIAVERVPSAPTLVLGPTSSTDLWTVNGTAAKPQAAVLAASHPLLENIQLPDVIIDETPQLQLNTSATTLVESTDGVPLYSLIPRAASDVIVLSFSPAKSDLAKHDDFPRLIAGAIAWLARDNQPARSHWRTDDTIALRDASGQLSSPYGATRAGGATLNDAGLWRVEGTTGSVSALLPVNLASPTESDLRSSDAQLRTAWPHVSWWPDLGPLWSPLAALALIWIAGHWAFYQRRVID